MACDTLPEGSPRRATDKGCHYTTARHAPWSHSELYTPALLEYDKEVQSAAQVQAYEKKYGSSQNLYLNTTGQPNRVTGIKIQWGAQREDRMGWRLDHDDPVARLNLAKILSLYLSDTGIGRGHGAAKYCRCLHHCRFSAS